MGTRGVYGFRIDGRYKLTYNHWDSNPERLGVRVTVFIRTTPKTLLKTIARSIVLVDEETPASENQIAECARYADLTVGSQQIQDWYCLLRKTQGDLQPYAEGLRYMIDRSGYVKHASDCEWTYVFDVDADRFEIYAHDCMDSGRVPSPFNSGMSMVECLPGDTIRMLNEPELRELLAAIETLAHWKEDPEMAEHREQPSEFQQAYTLVEAVKAKAARAQLSAEAPQAPAADTLLRDIYDEQQRGATALSDSILAKLEAYFGRNPGRLVD